MLDTVIDQTGTDQVTGVETMAYAGDAPWGNLGTPVHNDLTPKQMLEKAGLDWEVRSLAMRAQLRGKNIPIPGRRALVRDTDGKVFSDIGKDWKPVQNHEAFDFFHEFVMNGGMEMHTAGALNGGRHIWVLARIKDGTFELPGNDVVEQYLLLFNPHQYGMTLGILNTNIRVWCQNTLTMALSQGKQKKQGAVFFNHRRAFDPEYAKEVLGLAEKQNHDFKEQAEFLASKRTTQETLEQYFGELFGQKKNGDATKAEATVREHYDTQPGVHAGEGTWWQAVNSVTYAFDHELGRGIDTRLTSSWFGRNAQIKRKAVDLALEYAA